MNTQLAWALLIIGQLDHFYVFPLFLISLGFLGWTLMNMHLAWALLILGQLDHFYGFPLFLISSLYVTIYKPGEGVTSKVSV